MRPDLSKALAVVISVCIRRAEMDDMQVSIWTRRMAQALGEYPIDIALSALNSWPKTEGGKFWPTENEIRAQCEALDDARRRYDEADRFRRRIAPPDRQPLSPFKTDAVRRFAEKVRADDPRTAEIYLDHDATFRGNEIHLSPIGVVKLQPFAALAEAVGLKIVERSTFDIPNREPRA